MKQHAGYIAELILLGGLLSLTPARGQVIIDEDFTDGRFDGVGAGPGGRHWKLFGDGDVAFRTPHDRPDIPLALARRIGKLGHAWSGALYGVWDDKNGDGAWNDGELRSFGVDKRNGVVVLRFTGFSDIADRNENYYGVEVAMMAWADALQGPPHYAHDLSFEARLAFAAGKTQQLEGNVENISTWAGNIHWPGGATSATLSNAYTSVVVWRNRPGAGRTNCEMWGTRGRHDADCGAGMNGDLNPDAPEAEFDHIQVTLFRSGSRAGNVVREGIAPEDAQVGVTHVEVGITTCVDFNLDYRVDTNDYCVLTNSLANGVAHPTIREGDADNDGEVDFEDACCLVGLWNPPAVVRAAVVVAVDPASRAVRLVGGDCHWLEVCGPRGWCDATDNAPAAPGVFRQVNATTVRVMAPEGLAAGMNVGRLAEGFDAASLTARYNVRGSGSREGFSIVPGR